MFLQLQWHELGQSLVFKVACLWFSLREVPGLKTTNVETFTRLGNMFVEIARIGLKQNLLQVCVISSLALFRLALTWNWMVAPDFSASIEIKGRDYRWGCKTRRDKGELGMTKLKKHVYIITVDWPQAVWRVQAQARNSNGRFAMWWQMQPALHPGTNVVASNIVWSNCTRTRFFFVLFVL